MTAAIAFFSPSHFTFEPNFVIHQLQPRLKLADYFAIAFIVFLLIPQSTVFGRAELSVGCFGLWLVFSWGTHHLDTFRKCSPMLLALALQVTVYLAKSLASDSFEYLWPARTGFVTITLSLYICAHYCLHNPQKLIPIRAWSLIGVAVCISQSIAIAWQQPGVVRLLVSQEPELVSQLRWQGVPGYALIYTTSMCLFVFIDLLGGVTGVKRILLSLAIGVFIIHVALSMLALPTTLLASVAIAWLIHAFINKTKETVRAIFILAIILVFMNAWTGGTIFEKITKSEQIEKTISKVERLALGVSERGLVEGDETTRGRRLQDTFETFLNNPIFGRSFSSRAKGKIGGHSSLIDPLALFGIIGFIPMWIFYFLLIRNSLKFYSPFNCRNQWRSPEVFAWCFFGIASFWNSTTFTVLPFALLFLTVVNCPEECEP